MEKHDLVLNLHGEVPSGPDSDITVLNAEEAFLPTLFELHQRFPKVQFPFSSFKFRDTYKAYSN